MPPNRAPIGGGGSAPKPVANVKTGANPRGVAVVAPKVTTAAPKLNLPPAAFTKGANPRGVSLGITPHAPTVNDVLANYNAASAKDAKAAKPLKVTGAFRGLYPGAIRPPGFIGGGAGILSTLGDQIFHLPQTTLEGAIHLGLPALSGIGDLVSGNISGAGHQAGELGHQLKIAALSDPFVESVRQGSLKPLAKNPLGTALDLTGAYGLVGKGLGAGLRAAGSDAAALGGREARLAAADVPGSAIARGYSPNYLTQLAQKAGDKLSLAEHTPPIMKRALTAKANHDLRLQVASMHAAKQGELASEERHIMRSLNAGKPADKEEAAIAPLVALTGGGRDLMNAIHDRMLHGDIPLDPDAQASRERMLADLHAMQLKDAQGKFDWGATEKAAAAYKPMADLQEIQKAVIDGRDVTQMARHLDNVRALRENDVHYLDKPVTDPRRKQDLLDAKKAQREAQANLRAAERNRAAYVGTPEARGAYRGASNALSQLTKVTPVDPATDTLVNHMLDMRQILDEQHPQLKAYHKAEVELRKEELAAAKRATAEARAAVTRQPMQGTVIEDPNVPQLRSGPLKGLSVRPLTAEDAAAIRRRGPDPAANLQSYVSSRNPERAAAQSAYRVFGLKAGDQLLSPAEKGAAPYTGESLNVGDMRSGWSALPNTLLSNARRLSEAKETHDFLDRFELKNHNLAGTHEPWATLADAKRAANEYEHQHGLQMSVVQDQNGVYHVVPKTAVRELNRQRAIDHPGTAAKFLTTPNRIFRETVLPYSPKLPVMHTVENTTRTLLDSGVNPARILGNLRLQKAVDRAMVKSAPGAQERLTSLATPGSLSRSGVAGEAEDQGRLVTDSTPVPKLAVQKVTHFMSGLSTQIIRGQRALEKGAQRIALGEHERTLLGEFGVSYRAAKTEMDAYAQKLADQLAKPADAERAARAVHDAVGKYNAFTANTRLTMRVMPFGAWYVNAARLIFAVLPRDHPLFDALMQDSQRANAKQWNAQHAGLPEDLQTAFPVGNNAYLDIGKLTPIGLPGQSPATTLAQLTLPEYSSAALALGGAEDPFGAALEGPNTPYGKSAFNSVFAGKPPVAWGQALEQIAEAMGGPLNDISRALYGHGGVLYNTSEPVLHLLHAPGARVDIKPNSTTDEKGFVGNLLHLPPALDKVLDPFHPTTYHAHGTTPNTLGKPEGTLGGGATSSGLGKPEGTL